MPDVLIEAKFVPKTQLDWSGVLRTIQALTDSHGPSDSINFVRRNGWLVGQFVDMSDAELTRLGMNADTIKKLASAIIFANIELSDSSS